MVVIDVTEQKETEAKLSKAIEDANVAYKTQAEFLANMSHEIRTPINGILGMIQLTLMGDDLQADYRDNRLLQRIVQITCFALLTISLISLSWKLVSTRLKKKSQILRRLLKKQLLLRYLRLMLRALSLTSTLVITFLSLFELMDRESSRFLTAYFQTLSSSHPMVVFV